MELEYLSKRIRELDTFIEKTEYMKNAAIAELLELEEKLVRQIKEELLSGKDKIPGV